MLENVYSQWDNFLDKFWGVFLSTVSTGYHVNHFFLSSFLKREKAIYFIFALIFSGIVEKGDSFGFLDFLDYLVFLDFLVYPAPGASKSRFSFCSSLALHYL